MSHETINPGGGEQPSSGPQIELYGKAKLVEEMPTLLPQLTAVATSALGREPEDMKSIVDGFTFLLTVKEEEEIVGFAGYDVEDDPTRGGTLNEFTLIKSDTQKPYVYSDLLRQEARALHPEASHISLARISELAFPTTFHISLFEPADIYHVLDQSVKAKTAFPASEQLAGELYDDGLFSEIFMYFRLPAEFPQIEAYSPTALATFRDPSAQYFTMEERQRTFDALAESHSPENVELTQNEYGNYVLLVHYPGENFNGRVELGWENEREKWLGQIRIVDEKLRMETLPSLRTELENARQHLIDNPTSVPESEFMAVVLEANTATPAPGDYSDYLPLVDAQSFEKALRKLAQLTEEVVNTVSNLKGNQQTGEIYIDPASIYE